MAESSDDIPYYFDDANQKNLEKLIEKFQETSDVSLLDKINIYTFSQNDIASEREGVPRLCQAVVRLNCNTALDLQKYQILYRRFELSSSSNEEYIKFIFESLFQLIEPFVRPRSYTVEKNWLKQRNVCFVMAIMIGKYGKFVDLECLSNYLNYFLRVTENIVSNDSQRIGGLLKEAVLYAVICLDNLMMLNQQNEQLNQSRKMLLDMNKEIKNTFPMFIEVKNNETNQTVKIPIVKMFQLNKILINKIRKKFEKLFQFTSKGSFYNPNFDSVWYQIGFLAKWSRDYTFTQASLYYDEYAVKILEYSVRNFQINKYSFVPVRCSFDVSSDVFYYEVVLLTSGSIRIGWATSVCHLAEEPKCGIGEDQFSIGFDGKEGCIWHKGKHELKNVSPWNALDVIGCLIDVSQQKFSFYLNGKEIQFNCEKVYFSSLPYFAVVTLSPHQQCIFNFGQNPFKCLPKNIKPANFHAVSKGNKQKYRLMGFLLGYSNDQFSTKTYLNFYESSSTNFESSNNEHQQDFNRFIKALYNRNINIDEVINFQVKFRELHFRQGIVMLNESLNSNSIKKQNNIIEHIDPLIRLFSKDKLNLKMIEFVYLFWKTNATKFMKNQKPNNEVIQKFCLLVLFASKLNVQNNVIINFNLELSIEYMLNVIEKSKSFDLLLLEILTLEMLIETKIVLKESINENKKKRISNILEKLAKFFDQVNVGELIISTNSDDFFKYQIGFCSRWQLDELLSQTDITQFSFFKLLKQLDARNDDQLPISTRSSSAAHKPEQIYYYEITLITGGFMKFGWATREIDSFRRIGSDKFSTVIGEFFEITHQGVQWTTPYMAEKICWKRGDVIGCLIDTKNKKFVFYINGVEIKYHDGIFFSNQPYFAIALIDSHQQCHFNFGQELFVHLPKERGHIFDLNDKDGKHVTLVRPFFTEIGSFYKLNLENVIFCDDAQIQFDKFILNLEKRVLEANYCCGDCEKLLNHFIKIMQFDTQTHLRLIQSVIEKFGTVCFEKGNENLIQHELLAIEEHLKQIEIKPNAIQLLEMLYPYLNNELTNSTKTRNICIVLSMYSNEDEDEDEDLNLILYEISNSFLSKVITESHDNLTVLYATICLERFSTNETSKKDIVQYDWKRHSELSNFSNQMTAENLYASDNDYIKYQTGFCLNWFNEKTLAIEIQAIEPIKLNSVTLDPKSATPCLKLSSNLLSARNDSDLQSVYCNFAITFGIYYYETILLTSGSMLIGWDTKNEDQMVKSGKKSNLFAMNGYNKVISVCGIGESLESEFNSWKFGDVVGCLIDCKQHKFVFYLNGKLIYHKENVEDFSTGPYFARAILSSSQHCYFNFGQSKFKYAPNLLFKDFHEQVYNDNICQLCNLKAALGRVRTECCQLKTCFDCLNEPICTNCQTV